MYFILLVLLLPFMVLSECVKKNKLSEGLKPSRFCRGGSFSPFFGSVFGLIWWFSVVGAVGDMRAAARAG